MIIIIIIILLLNQLLIRVLCDDVYVDILMSSHMLALNQQMYLS